MVLKVPCLFRIEAVFDVSDLHAQYLCAENYFCATSLLSKLVPSTLYYYCIFTFFLVQKL